MIQQAWQMLIDPANWSGDSGFGTRLMEHLVLTLITIALAIVIAVPLGLLIGHAGKGKGLVIGASGALRALPSLGLLTILALWVPSGIAHPEVPSVIVLLILALPPLLAGTYSGVEAIPPAIAESARAIGNTEGQILAKVEVPLAASSIMDGIRSASLQVIATATLCSYLGAGGLGRYLIDGLATRDYPMVLSGAILVIALALAVEAILALVSRFLVPHESSR